MTEIFASLTIVDTPIGQIRFARCFGECCAIGELTIIDAATDETRRVFPPGAWYSASVFDRAGHPLYSIAVHPGPIIGKVLAAQVAGRN